jgi:hypothetical protein
VLARNTAHEGQAQPRAAAHIAQGVAVAVALENRAHGLLADPAAVVADGEDQLRGRGQKAQRDLRQALGVDETVGDQVEDHLLEQHAVAEQAELALGVEPETDVRPQQGHALDDRAAERGEIERSELGLELSHGGRAHDGGVLQQARDGKDAALHGAEPLFQLGVAQLFGTRAAEVLRQAQVHQRAAHRIEEGVAHRRQGEADLRKEKGLRVVELRGADVQRLSAYGRVGGEDARLRLGDLAGKERRERLAHELAAEQLLRARVGVDDPPAAHQQRRLAREREHPR